MAELGQLAVAGLIARLRAGVADFSAGAAGDLVELRIAEHEVVRGVGHLRAVEQEANVMRIGVLSAFLQAVMNCVKARVVDFFAGVDAFIHFRRLMFVNVGHGFVAFWFWLVF